MKTVLLRFIVSVCLYFAISFPPVFASSDLLTHIYTLKKHGRAPTIVFSPDGKLMAGGSTATTGATVNVWSMDDLQPVHSIKGVSEDVVFSPDGSVFITCMRQSIQLWDVGTWRVIGILAERMATITSVTFSHDGQILAAGDWDGTIRLWDLATQRNILTVNGHKHPDFDDAYRRVSSLNFSPDDRILASASRDNTVKLWNVDSGDEIATLNHVGSVYTTAFSPDGATLVSGASGGPQQRETLKVWDASHRKQHRYI